MSHHERPLTRFTDRQGKPLAVGDEVIVRFQVENLLAHQNDMVALVLLNGERGETSSHFVACCADVEIVS